jgi:molybdopterin/thiamine biosynthesis adenylyltransferase
MIVLTERSVKQFENTKATKKDVYFTCWDDGDVYSILNIGSSQGTVPGTLFKTNDQNPIPMPVGNPHDRVRVIISAYGDYSSKALLSESLKITGYVLQKAGWKETEVHLVPVRSELFSRSKGLLETEKISDKRLLIAGVGSVGSQIAVELAKTGVQIDMIDHDRLEVGNVTRHDADLFHVGRYKTNAMADRLRGKNPYITVGKWENRICFDNIELVREIIKQNDIIICATDNRPSKIIINKLCVEENKLCIFAGLFPRAYGGQILFVNPHHSPCYQCFVMLLPEQAKDVEISGRQLAERLSYTDRPVPIEPGLSIDIAPINTMVVKLVIMELLRGTETTLRSLEDDLTAPWLLWLNRREAGTQYENLEPLGFNIDGMRILRWYGIDVKRHPACPICGDFEGHLAKQKGLHLN